jgi:hypothetical protein
VNRKDYLNISVLIFIAIALFYPLFYSEYSYTDDWFALWTHESGQGLHGLTPYGRYLTERLINWLYNYVDVRSVHDLVFIRLFSLFGWLICLPVWYFIIKKIVSREKLPGQLVFFSTLYLICTPPFSVYVGWASCFEHFMANTAGLVSGFLFYSSINYQHKNQNKRSSIPFFLIAFSLLFGVISLFIYQNGFGCFLFPFLLHVITNPKRFRVIFIGIGFYLFSYAVYYLLFKYSLMISHIDSGERTRIGVDVFPKLKFFFSRPLTSAFHFTYLFNEQSVIGFIVYAVIFTVWLITDFYNRRFLPVAKRLKIVALIISMFALVYLPSLIVKEIYSSNRTLLALNMAVFFLVANTVLHTVKNHRLQSAVVSVISFLFVINAWYNFNKQFRGPVKDEYRLVRNFIESNYSTNINAIYFIQPAWDFFEKKYGVTRSWDEFGVPSTYPDWVAEFFVKQVVFEKTGNRAAAERLIIKRWSNDKDFLNSSPPLSQQVMLVNVEEIMDH